MPEIIAERVCADPEGGVVLFLIGIRINRPWKFWAWWPVFLAMPRMLRELGRQQELGLLSARTHVGLRGATVVQYWRSAEQLLAYAHAGDRAHLPAWQAFNRAVGSNGDVGIWHETYVAPQGAAESIYVNMPRYGLGLACGVVPAKGERASAAKRLTVR